MTAIEYKILNNLPNKYKYISRDSYGDLKVSALPLTRKRWDEGEYVDVTWEYMYDDPYECSNTFGLPYPHLFKSIKWEDEEMRLIEDIKSEVRVNDTEVDSEQSIERALLLELPSVYKYIVRDEQGDLEVCSGTYKEKCFGMWLPEDNEGNVEVDWLPYPDLFKKVSWKDEVPCLIKDLIESHKVKNK